MIDVNGMAHVVLTVSQFDKARAFYSELLPFFGMTRIFDGADFCYHVGGRTAIGIQRSAEPYTAERFVQLRVGLHHICLRARSRDDVDQAGAKAAALGATIVRGPADGPWAPGYYYVLFEDPDGIRLEVNYVPGQGLLREGAHFEPSADYPVKPD